MKSILGRFKNLSRIVNNDLRPYWKHWSSFIRLAVAIENQGFSKRTIHHWFYELVDEDDYSKSDIKDILTHLDSL